ncbi:MAG TPA: HlyC/CorC family transporter [Clostridiaceae bacterium]|nr:HlyC/CorC family transporter [Clostridiaceae bacterium]
MLSAMLASVHQPDLPAVLQPVGNDSAALDLLLVFILILINAFFAASEMAIVTLNDNRVRKSAEEGNDAARKLLHFIDNQGQFLATIQVGVTLAGFLSSAFAADKFAGRLALLLDPSGQNGTLQTISLILITLILAYFSLVLGELVPKRMAMQNPESFSRRFVTVLQAIDFLFRPITKLLNFSGNLVLRLFGIDPADKRDHVTEEEIRIMAEAGVGSGDIRLGDVTLIKNIFAFDDKEVSEIMTPRTNMVAMSVHTAYDEAVELAANSRFSRFPVYDEDLDDIVGVLYIKDLLRVPKNLRGEQFDMSQIVREPYFIPDGKKINVLFREMKQQHVSLAVVVDEYGGTDGIISMEDLLEEIVGDIEDEYDELNDDVVLNADGSYTLSGLLTPAEAGRHVKALDELEDDDDYDTVAGFVLSLLGYIPAPNEHPSIDFGNLRFQVLEMDDKRIARIRLDVLEKTDDHVRPDPSHKENNRL